jgi:hypothetical protein
LYGRGGVPGCPESLETNSEAPLFGAMAFFSDQMPKGRGTELRQNGGQRAQALHVSPQASAAILSIELLQARSLATHAVRAAVLSSSPRFRLTKGERS